MLIRNMLIKYYSAAGSWQLAAKVVKVAVPAAERLRLRRKSKS